MDTDPNPRIYVDIDGPNKGQNKLAVDIFCFMIDKENSDIKVHGSIGAIASLLSTAAAQYPTTWVVQYDNMDYLKLNNFTGSGKCPNGKELNDSANPPVITCK